MLLRVEFFSWLCDVVALRVSLVVLTLPVMSKGIDFNRDIRPILSENCFYCHGQDANKRQADLRLDVRQAAIDGGAITPGDAEASELIARILSDDPSMQMPPPDSNRRLTAAQKASLQQWIADGATFEEHWAFVAPQRPTPPEVGNREWPINDIDRFVLAKLEAAGLSPSERADRATLIRRLHADLTGLPPSVQEVDAFVNSSDPWN
ncbi:MAG: c-type cytochrome domain-containing protein [Pirellulaceae bacterium]